VNRVSAEAERSNDENTDGKWACSWRHWVDVIWRQRRRSSTSL